MVDPSHILPHMEVIASDGTFMGRVDAIESGSIKLTRSDSVDGQHHLLPLSLVARVDRHVHLNVGPEALPGLKASAVRPADATSQSGTITSTVLGAGAGAATAGSPAPATPASPAAAAESGPSALPPVRNPAVEGAKPRSNYYLPWLLGLLLALVLLVLMVRSCDTDDDVGVIESSEGPAAVATRDAADADSRYAAGTMANDLDRFLASDEPAPRTFTFERLNFDTGSAAIRPEEVADLDQLAQVMTAHPVARVAVIGYADASGSRRANARLGGDRADAVLTALTNRGIARGRLESRSGGEADPVAANARSDGRAENRRTELIVLSR